MDNREGRREDCRLDERMSHKDLIFSEDFAAYRKEQVKVVVAEIKRHLTAGDHGCLTGAMDMAKKILRLPRDLTSDEKLKTKLAAMLNEDFNRVYVELARQGVEDE